MACNFKVILILLSIYPISIREYLIMIEYNTIFEKSQA
jgi:hypothetical protein